ncbi:MAG TPA: type 4a pilus biogenesis protein PilO [Candidatus Babeliales bacterium]|nr:type 4a pilus biogenesis protein PilO [Candidatus Babeliales bacterium]
MVNLAGDSSHRSLWSRYILTLLVVACSIAAWHYFYYTPLIVQEEQSIVTLGNLKQRQQQFYTVNNNVNQLQRECSALSKNITSRLSLNKQGGINNLFKKVVTDVTTSELLMTYCSPEKLQMKKWYKKQPLKFVAAGSFFDCVDLLEKIKNYKFFTKVPQLVMQKKNDILMLECTVQTYTIE